ncbi:MAG: rhodanese-like domain-containing protein [Elusimicrobia bacterium]|nr:rhodanese-like domain-containing protein [Elusimicrobiota bacterium]
MTVRRALLAALAALAFAAGACKPRPVVPGITVQELKGRMERKEKFVLLDVREPREYAKAKIEGSTLIPLGFLASRLGELDRSAKYVVHCKVGGRSASAVHLLREKGYDAVNLEGGIDEWSKSIDPSVPRY